MESSLVSSSPCVEGKLEVSSEIMNHPLGFVIDAGGSLTKIVYRSKEDYKNGKPLKAMEHGIVRLKSFTIEQLPSLLPFIKTNVDMALTQEHQDVFWLHTGMHCKFFKSHLDKELDIKTKLYSEMMGLTNSLEKHDLIKMSFHKTFPQNIAHAARLTKDTMDMMAQLEKMGEKAFDFEAKGFEEKSSEGVDEEGKSIMPVLPPEHYLMQLLGTIDYQSWIDQHLKHPSCVQTPSILLLTGSAGVMGSISENYKFKFLDYNSCCGKTLTALAEDYVGEKDFDKFIQLAEEGDSGKVDQSALDLKDVTYKEEDWYSTFPDSMLMFELGKLSSNNYKAKGAHSKADLAAGVLSMQMHTLSKILISCARINRIFRAFVCGSIFQFPHVRKTFERHFYTESLLISMEYGEPFKLHFFDNPGYLVSLGVWIQNVQEEKDRESLKSLSKI